mmetsp:Transcript_36307/g.87963  ORF Transcript_36307/g.87963 Transcript_36307/m.87963 type:complete len:119 (-) Transcript_36307:1800-2156(-)
MLYLATLLNWIALKVLWTLADLAFQRIQMNHGVQSKVHGRHSEPLIVLLLANPGAMSNTDASSECPTILDEIVHTTGMMIEEDGFNPLRNPLISGMPSEIQESSNVKSINGSKIWPRG